MAAEVGNRQRRDAQRLLPADMERRPAGHQQREVRTTRQEVGQRRGGGQHLLEVVQHQQRRSLLQGGDQPLTQRTLARVREATGATDRPRHILRSANGRQINQDHSVGEVVGELSVGGRRQGQARLAHTCRTDERQQTDALDGQHPQDRLDLLRAAHQRRWLNRNPPDAPPASFLWARGVWSEGLARPQEAQRSTTERPPRSQRARRPRVPSASASASTVAYRERAARAALQRRDGARAQATERAASCFCVKCEAAR